MDHRATRWWWTLARYGGCDRCGRDVARELIAYCFETQTAFCVRCADKLGIAAQARESKRAREARRARLIAEAESVPMFAGTA